MEGISSKEAVQLVKSFTAQSDQAKISSANLAEMLNVPEEQVVAKLSEYREAARRRPFVDRSGAVSAAIAFALIVGFAAGKMLIGPGTMMIGQTAPVVRTFTTPTSAVVVNAVPGSVTIENDPDSAMAPGSSQSPGTSESVTGS